MKRFPVFYFPHGAGPMPLLGEPNHHSLVSFLKNYAEQFPKPEAILIVSAHWETNVSTVLDASQHHLLFDYNGFPKEAYEISYQPPIAPMISEKVRSLLADHKLACGIELQRGLDHGVFVPLKLMYPDADIPCTQLSLVSSLDPELHIEIGRAISTLRDQGVLILGSGSSFHNMSLVHGVSPRDQQKSESFDKWLVDTCCDPNLDLSQRQERLANWIQAPDAKFSHPREEHLIPLHVCFGAANSGSEANNCAKHVFGELFMGVKVSAFSWEN
ncbi:MAG: dioxygenase [Pseudomonadales bacterium]|nr:dioxygenase [Pseudomonadales bacterium]